jgi:hypothetical protein
MNELRVDIGGSSRGFQIATDETKRIAGSLNDYMTSNTPKSWSNLQLLSQESRDLIKGKTQVGANMFGGLGQLIGFGSFVGMLEKSLAAVRQIKSESEMTGLSAEKFQQLSQIANEELPDGAAKFSAALSKLNVNIGEGTAKFQKWGIHARNANDAIFEMADRMKQMVDPAERAAMAVDLMGRGGAALVPMLQKGADALRQMSAGRTVFSDEDIKSISDAGRQVEEMENRVTIWAGKFISGIASAAQVLGSMKIFGGGGNDANIKADAATWWKGELAKMTASNNAAMDADEAKNATPTKASRTPITDRQQEELDALDEDHMDKTASAAERIAYHAQAIKDLTAQRTRLDADGVDYYEKYLSLSKQIVTEEGKLDQSKKKPTAQHLAAASHVDSISGRYASFGQAINPTLEIGREQLGELRLIRQAITSKKDIFLK